MKDEKSSLELNEERIAEQEKQLAEEKLILEYIKKDPMFAKAVQYVMQNRGFNTNTGGSAKW